jgi:hypothetical protein
MIMHHRCRWRRWYSLRCEQMEGEIDAGSGIGTENSVNKLICELRFSCSHEMINITSQATLPSEAAMELSMLRNDIIPIPPATRRSLDALVGSVNSPPTPTSPKLMPRSVVSSINSIVVITFTRGMIATASRLMTFCAFSVM